MAFDQPIEADSPDDPGLLSSIIGNTVMWLLGGDNDDRENTKGDSNDKEDDDPTTENKRIDRELRDHKEVLDCDDICGGSGSNVISDGSAYDVSCDVNNRRKTILEVDTDDPCPGAAATSGDSINQSDDDANNNDNGVDGKSEGKDSPTNLSPVSVPDFCDDDNDTTSSKRSEKSPRESPTKDDQSSTTSSSMDPSTAEIMNDLVAVMESNHVSTPEISNSSNKDQPATCMLQTSQGKLTSSSTTSMTASYSASTFTNAAHSTSINNNGNTTPTSQQNLPQSSMIQSTTSNSTPNMIRGKDKKMSWSDECGGRSLVEYFDEPAPTGHTKHWSSMRRKARHSFDAAETNIKGGPRRQQGQPQIRVIKSALKRSGSYSPPVASLFASDGRPLPSSTNSCSSSSSDSSFMTSRTGTMKSFRSISVIGSSSDESDLPTKMSGQSLDTQDSMAGVTDTKLNANSDVQCVPSTFGNGGIIIPRGGPDSRYLYPRNSDPRYQLTLGAGSMPPPPPSAAAAQQLESGKSTPDAPAHVKAGGSPNNLVNGRSSPGHHHHHFLPRHANGYVSPQYGFYVNITPPTPELFAKHERNAKHTQTYHQFQSQKKLQAPSPIPEGSSFGETQPIPSQAIPQRFVGRSSVPRPSSNRATQERDSQLQQSDGNGNRQQQQNSLKPTFTQNKKGMGMLLAENPHHGAVWMG